VGWTVLYIAFGIVALWLLGEVLLQYKARLRWRLLAFAGFAGVVLGVLIPSVPVIALGAIAFATGQTFVTLSFRRGFSTGWAIGGSPGESRRRRGGGEEGGSREPTLEVSDLEYQAAVPEAAMAAAAGSSASAVYEPQPLPDDTGQYGVYAGTRQEQQGDPHPQYGAHDPYAAYGGPSQDAYPGQDANGQDVYGQGQDTYAGQGQDGYAGQDTGQDTYAGQYDYGTGQQQYGAYSDPYIGTGTTAGPAQYGSYDSYGNSYDSYGGPQQHPAQDPYAGQYAAETPPGGVWVPQQRESEQHPPMPPIPPEEPAHPLPYGNGYDTGQNEQYRY
jgi:hypothetical protein